MKSLFLASLFIITFSSYTPNYPNCSKTFSQPRFFYPEDSIANKIESKTYNPGTLLWYRRPASKWNEALPVGNGRLGGMVFGGVNEERIQLNEDTYWTGGPYSTVVPGSYKYLPAIQKAVFKSDVMEANKLFGRHLMGYPVEQQKYQSLANLHLFFKYDEEPTSYKRWLDLETGVVSTQYVANGVSYRRDVFSSAPHQVIAVRLTADKPGSISFTANLRGVRNQTHSDYGTDYFRMDGFGDDGLMLTGKSADYLGITGRMKYMARVKAILQGGRMRVSGTDLIIENADAVTLYFTAATNFVNYKDVSGDEVARVEKYQQAVSSVPYDEIRQAHVADYQRLFKRVHLKLQATESSYLPTDERLTENISAPDPQLASLAYQFGRYALMASSRPGTQAANLQGIWNDDMNPPWDSKYTTNINTEMNYWPVESANLSECAEPLIKMMHNLTDQGSQVAKEHYNSRGWVCHQNTDLWMVAAPMDGPTWGTFTTAGAWLCTELWEHYLYTADKRYLADIYPVMKGSVDFFEDFLVTHPNGKWLVTNPSTSPENFPASKGNGPYFDEVTGSITPGTTICAGSSIDMQILTDLFRDYIKASKLIGADAESIRKAAGMLSRFPPPQIGKAGTLQEWTDDWGQLEKQHRHSSHMYGLYPGNVISIKYTPKFIDGCKAVLNQRGDGSNGWSRAWKAALWARLKDGNRANSIFKGYLKEQTCIQLFAKCGNPMQVDGTMGMTAAISEMLVQSQNGEIELLPALPDEWKDGEFNGVCTRGAFELNFGWKDKKVTRLTVLSKQGEACTIAAGTKIRQITCEGIKIKANLLKDGSTQFQTVAGKTYNFNI